MVKVRSARGSEVSLFDFCEPKMMSSDVILFSNVNDTFSWCRYFFFNGQWSIY